MTKAVTLNNVDHKDLKIDTRYCAEYGNNVNRALVFTSEFGELQREYPILFHKDPETENCQAHVLLGLERDENLFLNDNGWQARYIPAVMARGPFMIGFQKQGGDSDAQPEPVIHIEMDNPRVGVESGEPVFLPYGGDAPYLEKVSKALQVIHSGAKYDKTFFSILNELELLEPVNIEINLSNIEQISLSNYYTINDEKLSALNPEQLAKLHSLGCLKLAYLALSSLGNIPSLIDMKNKKSAIV